MATNELYHSSNERIAKNTIFLYFRMILVMAISFYTSRITLEILGIDDFGVYNVVGSIVLMFSFLNSTLSSATSRFITVELGKNDFVQLHKIFNITFLCHIVIAIIVIILGETLGLWYFYNKLVIPEDTYTAAFWVYQISIITSLFSITQVPYTATIIAHENMKIYAYVGIFEVILKLGIVYLLIVSPVNKLVFYAFLQFLVQLLLILFYKIYCIKHYPESRFKLYWDSGIFKNIMSYSSSSLLNSMSVELQGQGINLLLNAFFGPVVNAARAISYQVQGAVVRFSSNFMTATRPQIIKTYVSNDIPQLIKLAILSSCISCYLLLYFMAPVCLEVKTILNLWLGEYPAYTPIFLILILIQNMIVTVGSTRGAMYSATGKIHKINIITCIILAISFPATYILFKLGYDAQCAFYSTLFCVCLNEIVGWIFLKRYISFNLKEILVALYLRCIVVTIVSIIPSLIVYFIMDDNIYRLLTIITINTVSVTVSVLYIGFSSAQREKLVAALLNKIRKG